DLASEATGLIPSTAWKKERYAGTEEARWYPGETPSVAIGQGAAAVTPLQLAVGFSALVNGGRVMKPILVKAVYANDGRTEIERMAPVVRSSIEIPQALYDAVHAGLENVVHGARGTARRAKLPEDWGIKVAGKTGT